MQAPRRHGDALTAPAQHVGDEFLRHRQLGGVDPVVAEQQPAAEALFDGMQPVAHGGLADLGDEGLDIAQQHLLHGAPLFELGLQPLGRYPQRPARDLHHRPVGRGVTAQKDGDAHHAVIARQAHFRGRPVFHRIE